MTWEDCFVIGTLLMTQSWYYLTAVLLQYFRAVDSARDRGKQEVFLSNHCLSRLVYEKLSQDFLIPVTIKSLKI